MISDTYIADVELKPGFENVINNICKLQISRDNPRELISTFIYGETICLVFELVNKNENV